MEEKQAGTSLDSMISSLNTRILELQQLVITRNMYPANSVMELSAIDTAASALERQTLNKLWALHLLMLRSLQQHHSPTTGRASPPLWYIIADELDSLSFYMRGRLTLERVNMAINDMASYAEANSQLISPPKKRLAEDLWGKTLELRDIAMAEGVKGKYFFLETDIKGPALKLDNTGKAILTVLRHLGRISETRIGHHRVIILLRPQ
ncbi:Spindle and kinetochore-associated protein 1 [Dillenia turbinata]|uniref:SKA complex subunit 1 homolog n=1 Tax=Dillenia turbinata TaxID=194707 RepID=A0AAN8YZC4_9MAGN